VSSLVEQEQPQPQSGDPHIRLRSATVPFTLAYDEHITARVAMIVFNSVGHDTRVLKEADTLQQAGYQVAIFGLADNRNATTRETRASGVEIVRVDCRLALRRALRRARLAVLVAAALVAAPLLALAMRMAGLDNWCEVAVTASLGSWIVFGLWRARRAVASRLSRVVPARIRAYAHDIGLAAGRPVWSSTVRAQMLPHIVAFAPAVVHCHDLLTLPVGRAVARRLGIPLVYDSHEIFEALAVHSIVLRVFFRLMQRRYSRAVDGFITINDSIAATLAERYPRLPPAVIVRNAARFDPHATADDGRLRRAAGVSEHQRILLYQGGFQKHRGLEQLLRAVPAIDPSWRVVFMGWGNLEARLKAVARAVDPDGARITFLPGVPQDELRQWTAGADVGIIPYERAGLNHWFCTPNKLWEYPAAGVPILASPFPELRRAITESQMGWLLPDPLTPEGIAATVNAIDPDDIATRRLGCAAFHARDNWERYEPRLVGLYTSLMAGRRP